jgi:lysophospholipase L1-like esterase
MATVVGATLYLFLSGHAFFVGLVLVAAGVLARGRFRVATGAFLWAGMVLILVSAIPLHPGIYALLVASVVGWRSTLSRNPRTHCAASGVVLVLLLTLGLTEWKTRESFKPTIAAGRPVVVLGDSLSAGLASSREGTWPQLMGARRGLNVSNLARAGATLADGLARARDLPAGSVTVIVELGGNDILGGTRPDRFERDLRSLLSPLAAPDRRVVMLELPLLPFQNGYGRAQRRLCHQFGVRLLPRSLLAGALALPGHTTDGLHLSPEGHAWLAAHVGSWLWDRS